MFSITSGLAVSGDLSFVQIMFSDGWSSRKSRPVPRHVIDTTAKTRSQNTVDVKRRDIAWAVRARGTSQGV